MKCLLCEETVNYFQSSRGLDYYLCDTCQAIQMNPNQFINSQQEKARYQEHNNDVNDRNYQKFVSPIVEGVVHEYNTQHIGLDFGAGTGPVITKLLQDKGFNVNVYDPFFFNNPEVLEIKYDFIACCEVIEHFHNPYQEFKLLKSLLKPNGSLFIMTEIYHEKDDFKNWYYKNDPTHVFFYHRKTLEWIKKHYNFSNLEIKNRLIILK